MAAVSSSALVAGGPGDVWSLYFEADRWPSWVDQFAAVVSSRGYPEVGGELVWRSVSAGRGEVHERVVEHRPAQRHRVEFSDPSTTGTLTTSLKEASAGTEVTLELEYELVANGIFARVSDALFVRSQMRASLQRSLAALRLEAQDR